MAEPEPSVSTGVDPPSPSARGPRARSRSSPGSRRATVIGAGSFGTALAVLLARGGLRTTLQARTSEQAALLDSERENRVYLPEVELPGQLRIEPASAGVARADYVFLAVPSSSLGEVIATLSSAGLGKRAAVVSVAKGLVPPQGLPPTTVLSAAFGVHRVACLGGPAHAREMVRAGKPDHRLRSRPQPLGVPPDLGEDVPGGRTRGVQSLRLGCPRGEGRGVLGGARELDPEGVVGLLADDARAGEDLRQ